VPAHVVERPPLGGKVLVVTTATGPSDAAVRVATLLARPDGGHSDVMITRMPTDPAPDRSALRAVEKRIFRHGFDGHVHTQITGLADAVTHAMIAAEASFVIVDDPSFEASPGPLPLLVLDGASAEVDAGHVIAAGDGSNGVTAEIERRLARGAKPRRVPARR
jgi:hypothetical protein